MKAVALVIGEDTAALMAPHCMERPTEETLTVGYGALQECVDALGLASVDELDERHLADLEDFVGHPVTRQADGSFTYRSDFDTERPFDGYAHAEGLMLREPRRKWLFFTQTHVSRAPVGELDRGELEALCPFALVDADGWHESETTSMETRDDGLPAIMPDDAWRAAVAKRLGSLHEDDVVAYVVYHS